MLENIFPYLQVLTVVVLGIFSFIALFDRKKRQDNADTIENFKQAIDSMKVRMAEMEEELDQARADHQDSLQKIAKLTGENETLKSILLGKDPESIEYRSKSLHLLQMLVDEIKRHDSFVRSSLPAGSVG